MVRDILLRSSLVPLAYRALRWHLRYATGGHPTPLSCGFFLTTQCNFRCEFCNLWKVAPSAQIPEADAMELVRELGQLRLIYLAVGGGEPLLVPHVFEVLAQAKESGISFTHLVSNGFLMDRSRAQEVRRAKLSEISFSLDGDEAFHDTNRLKSGSFDKVLEAVQHVKSHAPGTGVVLNTILDPLHPENALAAVEIAEGLKVRFKVQPINRQRCFGTAPSNPEPRRSLEVAERKKLLSAIEQIQRSPSLGNSPAFLENYKAFLFRPDRLMHGDQDCLFGLHHFEVFGDRVFPCLEGLNGEDGVAITGRSVREVLTSSEYLALIQRLKKCSGCKQNYYICYYEPRLNFPVWNYLRSKRYRCVPEF